MSVAVKSVLRLVVLAMLLTSLAGLALAGSVAADDKQPPTRSLQGQVINADDAPLPDAIVYLKNTKTLMVKTFISQKDGSYHFNALSPNIDYQVHAEHHGKKSDVKTLSSFDSRKAATINLKIK